MPDGIFKYTKRGQPAWGVRLKYKNNADQWRAKTWRGFRTERQARTFRDQARDAREGTQCPQLAPASPTLRTYLQDWLDTYVAPNCKRSTALSYIRVINRYWLPVVGEVPVNRLSIDDCKQVLTALLDAGKSRQTIRNVLGPVREALNHAVGEQRLAANPLLALKPHLRQLRDPKRHIHPLTRKQQTALVNAARALDPTLHRAILLGTYTGMRPGELLGLQWQDIDWKQKTLTIRRARVWHHMDTPKNHHLRVIDLAPPLLKGWRPPKAVPPTDFLFQPYGRPATYDWYAAGFQQARQAAKLPPCTPKILRHTYASMMIAIGANPKYIQTQMGHSSIKVTFDIYGHLFQTERYADQLR